MDNEPNEPSQDDLTPAQYARMFKTYHDFFERFDPSARLVAAGVSALTEPEALNYNMGWWNQTLDEYALLAEQESGGAQVGANMPIDIWNAHPYTIAGRMDSQRMIAEFCAPFRQFVNTVRGGAYAGKELWYTEFGVWVEPATLDPAYLTQFIQEFCPQLETSGLVDRFFWYHGYHASEDAESRDQDLLEGDGRATLPGAAYRDLAWNWPHNAVLSRPDPPPPALRVQSDFDVDASGWRVLAGDWRLDNGAYRQTRTIGPWPGGMIAHLPYWYRDVRVDVDVKFNGPPAGEAPEWAGVTLRGSTVWDGKDPWGYVVFLTRGGSVGLHRKAPDNYYEIRYETPLEIPDIVADTSVYHRLGVVLTGSRFQISVDGSTVAVWSDDRPPRRSEGLVGLHSNLADCSFDNADVRQLRAADLDLDGDVDLLDFAQFQNCLSGADIAQVNPLCERALLDGDADVDGNDFAAFQAEATGATPD